MIGHRISPEGPLLNAPLDEEDRAELSVAFMRSAETGGRPWASIAIDDWLQASKWWLLKVRSQLNHPAEETEIKVHAYINILKACWILADIVSIHPQRVHLGASNKRSEDIRNLSQVAKRNLEDFPVFEFQLRQVEDDTINIWPQLPAFGTIAPRRQFGINRDNLGLQISHGEILFQCFAEIRRTTEGTVDTESISEECFLVLEVPRQGIFLNVMLKSFVAHNICKMEHPDALKAILRGFQMFSFTFHPTFLTASMVHSMSVLANWPSQNRNCLLLPDYDTGSPAPSDSLALSLRTIMNDVVKNSCQDKSQISEFFAQDCLDGKFLPLGNFVWKVICWHCDKFADMKLLLEGLKIKEDLRDSLIQTAFLRLDRNFVSHMVHYMNYRDGWYPDDVLIMVKAALSSNDAGYLLWILEHVTDTLLSVHQTAIFQLVYSSRRFGHLDAMMKVVIPRPADIVAALAWYLSSSDEQGFRDFLRMVEDRGRSFKGKRVREVDLSDFYPTFVAGCGRLIETQRSSTLSLYFDSLEGLGINFHGVLGRKSESTQLAILPALLSPDPSFLRILLEREMVLANMEPFVVEYESAEHHIKELIQYPPYSMPYWPLFCAVMLVCDTEFLQLLCQHGASLQEESWFSEEEDGTQEILDHPSNISCVLDARIEYMDTLMFCHILIDVGILGRHGSLQGKSMFCATDDRTDYRETWMCMKRLLYRDSFFSNCSGQCRYDIQGNWKQQPDRLAEMMSRYYRFPEHYSKHLLTQSSWDTWRQSALQILGKEI